VEIIKVKRRGEKRETGLLNQGQKLEPVNSAGRHRSAPDKQKMGTEPGAAGQNSIGQRRNSHKEEKDRTCGRYLIKKQIFLVKDCLTKEALAVVGEILASRSSILLPGT